MSWSIAINGHRDDQATAYAEIEEILVGIVETAVESLKKAGVTFADVNVYPHMRRTVFNAYEQSTGETPAPSP